MTYYITINGLENIIAATKDLAEFIAKKLKEARPENEIKIYKNNKLVKEVK